MAGRLQLTIELRTSTLPPVSSHLPTPARLMCTLAGLRHHGGHLLHQDRGHELPARAVQGAGQGQPGHAHAGTPPLPADLSSAVVSMLACCLLTVAVLWFPSYWWLFGGMCQTELLGVRPQGQAEHAYAGAGRVLMVLFACTRWVCSGATRVAAWFESWTPPLLPNRSTWWACSMNTRRHTRPPPCRWHARWMARCWPLARSPTCSRWGGVGWGQLLWAGLAEQQHAQPTHACWSPCSLLFTAVYHCSLPCRRRSRTTVSWSRCCCSTWCRSLNRRTGTCGEGWDVEA